MRGRPPPTLCPPLPVPPAAEAAWGRPGEAAPGAALPCDVNPPAAPLLYLSPPLYICHGEMHASRFDVHLPLPLSLFFIYIYKYTAEKHPKKGLGGISLPAPGGSPTARGGGSRAPRLWGSPGAPAAGSGWRWRCWRSSPGARGASQSSPWCSHRSGLLGGGRSLGSIQILPLEPVFMLMREAVAGGGDESACRHLFSSGNSNRMWLSLRL